MLTHRTTPRRIDLIGYIRKYGAAAGADGTLSTMSIKSMNTIIKASITTLLIIGLTFLLMHEGLFNYGLTAFFCAPFVVGLIIGKSVFNKESIYGLLLGLGAFSAITWLLELEGILCIVFAAPLILASAGFGVLLKMLLLSGFSEKNKFGFSIIPLLIFVLTYTIEHHVVSIGRTSNRVISKVYVQAESEELLEYVISMGAVSTTKSLLMHIGLPEPQKCEIKIEESDTIRVCYFEGGRITQRIERYVRGKEVELKILDYTLLGRPWLGFNRASYEVRKMQNGLVELIRETEYTTKLQPRIYWRLLEEWGIRQEHEYVFRVILDKYK